MVLQQRHWWEPNPVGITQLLKNFNSVFTWVHSRMTATFSHKTHEKAANNIKIQKI